MTSNDHLPTTATAGAAAPHQEAEPPAARARARWTWLLVVVVLGCAAYWLSTSPSTQRLAAASPSAKPAAPPVPVVATAAHQGDLPVYLTGLGTVTAFNTVTIKSRVDGQLINVAFREGQFVNAGDLLVEIDPRPFQVQLTQAQGQLARDKALLKDARINLERYQDLLKRDLISQQQVGDQAAQVGQYEGAITVDQAAIDNAKLQLIYCRITAPISGRIGLRLVDIGNIVHANDQNGLLLITQIQPITVVFTLPEDNLPPILKKLAAGERLPVEAFDRAGQTRLATGQLLTVDNQIDQSTGTTRLKALFENHDNTLFPNQFVNARLLIDVKKGAVIAPAPAIQRGPQGTFVYVVKDDQTVDVRPVAVGPTAAGIVAVESGLSPGEVVVVDGVEKLRAGSTVQAKRADSGPATQTPSA